MGVNQFQTFGLVLLKITFNEFLKMFCNDFIYYFIAIKTVMVASGETD